MPSFGEIELIDIKGRDIATLINELGADCWEMIGTGTQSEGDYHALYFKRPIE